MRVLTISHENDIDGVNCVVLGKLSFEDMDYLLYPYVSVLEANFRRMLDDGRLYSYDASSSPIWLWSILLLVNLPSKKRTRVSVFCFLTFKFDRVFRYL